MDSSCRRGFTLIEVLVAVGIMVVLSSIVLVAVSVAQDHSDDTAIKANLSTIQVAAETFAYATSNTYGTEVVTGNCTTNAVAGPSYMFYSDPTIKNAIANISKIIGVTHMNCATHKRLAATPPDVSYAVIAQLRSGDFWCIDSSGTSEQVDASVYAGGFTVDTTTCP